ncbi:MAG: hypothetical protein R3B13_29785 [Polyangiaceae bacterium]
MNRGALCRLAMVGLGLLACEQQNAPATEVAASGSSRAAPAPEAKASVAPPAASGVPVAVPRTPVEKVRLSLPQGLERTSRGYRGALPGGGSIALVFATSEQPLAARAPAALAGLAAEVAPAAVAPTAFRRIELKALLAGAKDDKTRRKMGNELRVLADGRVETTITLLPEKRLLALEVGRVLEGTRIHKWETELMSRGQPTEPKALLAGYQTVLALDSLCFNLLRTQLVIDEATGSVLALEDNDAFSAQPRDGAVGDGLARLSRHLTFSKSLESRLRELDRARIERAFSAPGVGLLVTPRQVQETSERRDALLRLFDRRIKQRGRDASLALP